MLYEQCFARLPRVRALDLLDDWRPAYGEWLGAQVGAGFDRTTTARLMEAADIAVAEADAGESDAAWMLRRAAADMGDGTWEALTAALDFVNAKGAGAPHTHAMTEADWKASPWYRKEIPFRPDMTETRARIMAENFDHRRYRDALIARGAEVYNGVGDMALGFGAMLLGGMPDPVNLLSLGGGMAAASRAATLGGAMRAGAKAGAAEGALFSAVADAIVLPDLATRGEDVEFADFALDTIAGALLGGVFGAAGGALARHRALRRNGSALPDTPDAPDVIDAPDTPGTVRAAETRAAFGDLRPLLRARLLNEVEANALDLADGSPVTETRALEEAYDAVLHNPLAGSPEDVLARLEPEDIEAVLVHRGPAVLRDGEIVVQGNALKKAGLGRSGYGLVKIIFLHGEKGNKRPDMPPITRQDVVALPRIVREYESTLEGEHRVWRVPREDGNVLSIIARYEGNGADSWLVSMYVSGRERGVSKRKPHSESSTSVSGQNRDTGQRINTFTSDGQNGASHMTGSSMPGEPAAVKGWDTPEAAREAEARELAQQDEALRQQMDELEARGVLDPDEAAHARAESADTAAIGNEVLHCAWSAEG